MYEVDLKKAKAEANRLIETALEGQEVVITKDDKPVLRLVPVNGVRRDSGSAKGQISISDDFDQPLEDFAEYSERDYSSTPPTSRLSTAPWRSYRR